MYYRNNTKGRIGEEAAEKYLRKRGYLFIARNYWTEYGELDLIFYRNFTLIFVEVKTRSGKEFGTGRESVNSAKQSNLRKTAMEFIKSHCEKNRVPFYIGKIPLRLKFLKTRYDVIEVAVDEGYSINAHLKGYFE